MEAIRAARRGLHPGAPSSAGSANPAIEILGNPTLDRLSIVSFVVRHGGRYLHHNFVVALLNDLFGIQSRGGCSCAGPYGHRLLGIDLETSHEFEREIARGCEGIKPGWVRVNFNYFISEAVFEYILDAVELVATRRLAAAAAVPLRAGDRALAPRAGCAEPPLVLDDIGYEEGEMRYAAHRHERPSRRSAAPRGCAGLAGGAARGRRRPGADVSADFEALRWFGCGPRWRLWSRGRDRWQRADAARRALLEGPDDGIEGDGQLGGGSRCAASGSGGEAPPRKGPSRRRCSGPRR